jgi:pSer/pThr/pTyr-binding forkhead associated (FHA) protein
MASSVPGVQQSAPVPLMKPLAVNIPGAVPARAPPPAPPRPAPPVMAHPPASRAASPGVCPNCGTALVPGFKFCGSCGQPIGAAPVAHSRPRARVSAIGPDGSVTATWPLGDEAVVGTAADMNITGDAYVSPRHARLYFREGRPFVAPDPEALNGTFLCLRAEREFPFGTQFRMGRQLVRLEPIDPPAPPSSDDAQIWGSPDPGYGARFQQLLEGGVEGDSYPLREGDNVVGRSAGDVSFPGDGYVSSRHAVVSVRGGRVKLRDLGSSNGTFFRVMSEEPLAPGDLVLVGEQLLRIDPA